ncbi:tail fiber assembly protein [Salmonella enterica subsp. enterica serovar Kiambu]|uniref:tail fiber assembly protein n=1 Tax=Salmonella enterica TaxID=28901 RepID=UPI0011213B25|nr:tail fiber assembly protein [Salmonella enterica]EBQ6170805.1 phage tail protein [Salmonella enterica subsp. enterica serovar Derby]EBU7035135.1 phage tail protein [Salmonella enterica subsp. enterica serovar Indiana]ELI7003288.1 tail fiber assembly protein [Citrobacter freundii]EAV5169619.1 tail fiber assembly protein [Salmonella enterica]EDT7921212.1 tail fiber assembly protein [Salmonella enterica subsp. enterica serovar Kiambu]
MTGNYSYIYDATTNAFYALALRDEYIKSGRWPETGVKITDEEHQILLAGQSDGEIISAGADGNPILTPALIDYVAIAVAERDKLMALATARINHLVAAQDDDDITATELSELGALREYRAKLRRMDLDSAPDIQWPPEPD